MSYFLTSGLKSRLIFVLVRLQGFFLFIFVLLLRSKHFRTQIVNRKSNRLFIFGSSYSINSISAKEWEMIRQSGDTMSFNMFYYNESIDIDYYVLREIVIADNYFGLSVIKELKNINRKIKTNDCYRNTLFFVMNDIFSAPSNLWLLLFGSNFKTVHYTNTLDRLKSFPISQTFSNIPHAGSTLFDCINLGIVLGYTEIVLVGIDLNDSRYFYLPYNETHWLSLTNNVEVEHPTKKRTYTVMREWHNWMINNGVSLNVYSKRSALADFLPLYDNPVK